MSDSSDDMEMWSGFLVDEDDFDDLETKRLEVIKYCEPHLESMWAARVVGILLGCDFRDCKQYLKEYYEHTADTN